MTKGKVFIGRKSSRCVKVRIILILEILFSLSTSTTNDLFKLLKWSTLDHQHKVSKSILLYKVLNS